MLNQKFRTMKSKVIFLAIILMGVLTTAQANPKTKTYKCSSIEQIQKKMKTSFQSVPFNEIDCNETSCTVKIYFKFDEDGNVLVEEVKSRNQAFVDYVKTKLDEHVYTLEKQAPKTMYLVTVTFIRES